MKPKMTMTLTKEEIEEALKKYVEEHLGKKVKGKIEFKMRDVPNVYGGTSKDFHCAVLDFEDVVEYKIKDTPAAETSHDSHRFKVTD